MTQNPWGGSVATPPVELEPIYFNAHLPNFGDVLLRVMIDPIYPKTLDDIVHSATMNEEGWIKAERWMPRENSWGGMHWGTSSINLSHFAMLSPAQPPASAVA